MIFASFLTSVTSGSFLASLKQFFKLSAMLLVKSLDHLLGEYDRAHYFGSNPPNSDLLAF